MQDDTPVDELLFELEMNLSKQFSAISPLTLRKERARDVFIMIKHYNHYLQKGDNRKAKHGKTVIRRPAGDDWF